MRRRADRSPGGRRALRAVIVQGPSMMPALMAGDCLLVHQGGRVRAGAMVVGTFPEGPPLLVVKRAVRPVAGGWWLESDNPLVQDDSRRYGPAVVLGPVLLRYWPVRPAAAAVAAGVAAASAVAAAVAVRSATRLRQRS